jgi:hypothetical protein
VPLTVALVGRVRPLGDRSGALCEVCERPTAEPITHPEEGIDFCGRCAVAMIGAERDAALDLLRKWVAWGDAGNTIPADIYFKSKALVRAAASDEERRT